MRTHPTRCTAAAASGGAISPTGTYTYQISSITAYGEQVAGTASSGVTIDSSNKTANLTWTADANAKLYMIWRKKDSGAYQLLDIINALTYDGAGKVNGTRASYSDAGAKTPVAVKPLLAGEEQIVFINTNPDRGVSIMGLVDDMGRPVENIASYVELARTKDSYDYMLKSYLTLKLVYPNLIGTLRHIKTSS